MKRFIASILLVFCAALGTSAQAYVTIRTQTGYTLHWESTNIEWTIETGGMPGMGTTEFQEAIEAAFQSWEDVDCSTMSFDYEGYKSWDSDEGIHVYVQTNSWDPTVGDALAYALPDPTWQGVIQSVDIVFNAVEVQWSTSPNPEYGYTDVQGVVSHEIGHAIGLDHPRYPDSTMFFSGGSTELRTLEDDDQRGACFLYPTEFFDDGIACDACEMHDNCAVGDCLQWGGSTSPAFCGEDCNTDSECPEGFYCYGGTASSPLVPMQCIPDNGYCDDQGGTIPQGEPCYGHDTCEGGLCLVLPDEVYCSQTCTSSCPSGMTCVGGACFKAGDKAYGALCDESSDCQTGMCVHFTSNGTCTQPCGPNYGPCPNGNQCYFDAVCVPPGTGLNGQPCYTPIQCQSTHCIEGTCTEPCTSSATCPAGTTCTAGYCDGVVDGGQCQSQNECPENYTCQKDTSSGPGNCYRACEPLADTGCFEDEGCQWRYETWAQYITGRCLPKNYGAGEGEACSASTPCEVNYICHLGKGTVETCHRDCKLFANNLGCTLGQKCETLGDSQDPKHGICTSTVTGPTNPDPDPPTPDAGSTPTPDAGSTPTPDATTPSTPDTGPVPTPDTGSTPTPDATTPPTPDASVARADVGARGGSPDVGGGDAPSTDDGGGGGCQSSSTTNLGWLALGFLALGAHRRRRWAP
ncbi:MAG: matrixin family metalloprotease [Myxococcota bacterium]|nr:matrixin family metalloprotease [Myxococcota bacterium]